MAVVIIPRWRVTVTVTRTLEYPVEDKEDKQEFSKWINSLEGKRFIQQDFIRCLNCYGYPRTADIDIEEIELKEYEVKSTDTDPRV